MLDLTAIGETRRPACAGEIDLYPHLAELLEDAPQVLLDFLVEDLAEYEQTGVPSATIVRLLERARCLADVDRITARFAD